LKSSERGETGSIECKKKDPKKESNNKGDWAQTVKENIMTEE